MSGTTWSPAKVQGINATLTTYTNAVAALAALNSTDATARVLLSVSSPSTGSVEFGFILEIAHAIAVFAPVVDGLAAALTAQGVDLSTPAP